MPDDWTIQRLMSQHNLSFEQATKFYWYRREGYDENRALNLVRT